MRGVCRSLNLLQLVSVLCLGVLLFNTYRLYKGSYFWLDDFENLYWVQQESFAHMIGHIVNPVSSYFRPTGMMCYWILLRFFDLNPAAYHCLMWCVHGANTALIYFLLKRFTQSTLGAAVGAMLFASQAVFAKVYWDFGTIFELVAGFFSSLSLFLWTSERRGWSRVLLASVTLVFAMKGKEMALAMPLIWLSYDLLLRKNMSSRMAAHWILPGFLAVCYGLTRADMRRKLITDPYYIDIGASTLVNGFKAYFNMLLGRIFAGKLVPGFRVDAAGPCAFTEPSRVVLTVLPFLRVSTGDFLDQSSKCLLLVPSVLGHMWARGDLGQSCRDPI